MVLKNVEVKAVGVDNVVVWDNPSFYYHQKGLSKGSMSIMGNVLALSLEQKKQSRTKVGIRKGHNRSATWLDSPKCQRLEAFFWRDVNLKGVGRVSGDSAGGFFRIVSEKEKTEAVTWARVVNKDYDSGQYLDSETEVRGLLDYVDALNDTMWAEQLHVLGVRTHRTLGIILLKQLVTLSEGVCSVESLKQKELLPGGFTPVLQVRALGTEFRISDLSGVKLPQQQTVMSDVYQLIGEELALPFSEEDYLEWFASTLGKNIGLLHQAGLFHGSINPHNVTLDCRLVDHDTMRRTSKISQQYAEAFESENYRTTCTGEGVLRLLCIYRKVTVPRIKELLDIYRQHYSCYMPVPDVKAESPVLETIDS